MSSTRQLDLGKITAAALAIADAEGFSAVSMRRVAQELGVGTMSLYHYVKTKAELIAAMDDALMAQIVLEKLPLDWREALMSIAFRTRDVLVKHPWALSSMLSAPPGLNAMRHMEQCLQALAQTEMTMEQKLTLLALMDDFVFGYALRESAREPVLDADAVKKRFASGAFPELTRAFGKRRTHRNPDRFRLGLEVLLRTGDEQIPRRNVRLSQGRRKTVREP
ncbi:MAG: TetR/AcrR family transcriptional regulator C-terminal domain-containing protein [Acidobacteriaceae bacterium]|nr:TetR/AcrR family transcriptional regulator C-terminal domain-containing protein [Acidobacteriaceae bacterium]